MQRVRLIKKDPLRRLVGHVVAYVSHEVCGGVMLSSARRCGLVTSSDPLLVQCATSDIGPLEHRYQGDPEKIEQDWLRAVRLGPGVSQSFQEWLGLQ